MRADHASDGNARPLSTSTRALVRSDRVTAAQNAGSVGHLAMSKSVMFE